MNFITRAQWGARSPSKLNSSGVRVPVTPVIVPWADRIGVAYHIQDGNRANGPANLQNYAMDSLNYSDSHYNLSTKDGTVYEQRGITVLAAHAATSVANHNRAWVGVVVFGRNGDVTDLDLQTLTEIHRYIENQADKPLLAKGHGQLFGSETACPDQKILAWLAAGGPSQGGNMGILDERLGSTGVAETFGPRWADQPLSEWFKYLVPAGEYSGQAVMLLTEQATKLAELEVAVNAQAGELTQLKEAIDSLVDDHSFPGTPQEFEAMHERVMRKILGGVDGATPSNT